jgi:CBS domain containing-hemolysin-like protein
VIEIIVVFLLLIISGAFSGTEVAFTSLSVDQLEEFRKQGRRERLVAKLHDQLDVVLTSITIGNNLANLAASALVSALTIRLFGEAWLTVSTVVLTILVLIIGEVTPKQIGIIHNAYVTAHLSRFLNVFSKVFAPLIFLVRMVSNALTRLTGRRSRPKMTAEGLRHMVRYAGNIGVLNQLHASILKNVIRSREVRVGAIMTHRKRIHSIEKRVSCDEAFPKMLESGFSRFPVYDGDPEEIVGVVILKDVAREVVGEGGDTPLSRLMVEPIFVPESRSFHEVLSQLQSEHVNMAVVLDEYGGVAGLVTIEDLVEEFVGELYDENEIEEARVLVRVGEGEYRMPGDAPIHVVQDQLDIEIPEMGEAQTIGGYITERMGRIPDSGESFEIPHGTFTVAEVSEHRIMRLRFRFRKPSH